MDSQILKKNSLKKSFWEHYIFSTFHRNSPQINWPVLNKFISHLAVKSICCFTIAYMQSWSSLMEKIVWIPLRCFFWKRVLSSCGKRMEETERTTEGGATFAWGLLVYPPSPVGSRWESLHHAAHSPTHSNKSCNPWYRKTNMGVDLIRTRQNSSIWAHLCSVTEHTVSRSCYDKDRSGWQSVMDWRELKVGH